MIIMLLKKEGRKEEDDGSRQEMCTHAEFTVTYHRSSPRE